MVGVFKTAAPALVALACALTGCGDESVADLRVASYNVGLAFGYVEEAPQRIQPIAAALNDIDVDVLCLQELWTFQDESGTWTTAVIDDILARTGATYPQTYFERTFVPPDAPQTGCELAEADTLLACAEPACGDIPSENLADCVLENCTAEFNATSASCQNCMVSNLGMELGAIVAACRGLTKGGVVYDGHNGLALLSKYPLRSTEMLQFDYALTSRAILHAEIDWPGKGATDVYCTHLASNLSPTVAYPENGPFGSFAEENMAQTDAMLSWMNQTATSDRRIVMGDFNHGPGGGSVLEQLPGSYARVRDAGYSDPVSTLAPLPCTFCDSNILNGRQGPGGELIDHVYLDAATGANAEARIAFEQLIDIVGGEGGSRQVNLSDHFGVVVDL